MWKLLFTLLTCTIITALHNVCFCVYFITGMMYYTFISHIMNYNL